MIRVHFGVGWSFNSMFLMLNNRKSKAWIIKKFPRITAWLLFAAIYRKIIGAARNENITHVSIEYKEWVVEATVKKNEIITKELFKKYCIDPIGYMEIQSINPITLNDYKEMHVKGNEVIVWFRAVTGLLVRYITNGKILVAQGGCSDIASKILNDAGIKIPQNIWNTTLLYKYLVSQGYKLERNKNA